MPVTDSAFKPEKVKILTIVKPLLLTLRAPAHRTVTFIAASCRAASARCSDSHLGKAWLRSSPLHRTVEEISLVSVKKGMFALLALLVALHAGFACGMAQGAVAIKAPCCGANCPVPFVRW
jgi:hypothetical protein